MKPARIGLAFAATIALCSLQTKTSGAIRVGLIANTFANEAYNHGGEIKAEFPQEVGYPTSANNGSSEDKQADFFSRVLDHE